MEVWGWLIAIYLFLGGVGAGAYLTSFAANKGVFGYAPDLKRCGYIISAPIVGIGALLLVFDLGQGLHKPWLLIGLLSNPHSVMSWGTGILSVFILLGLVRGYLAYRFKAAPKLLDYAGAVFAVATAAYTGMLLVAVRAVPFWHNYFIPFLFLVSALSTGMSITALVAHFLAKEHTEQNKLCRVHLMLVAAELLLLFAMFTVVSAGMLGPVASESGAMLMYDQFALVFWLVLIGVGLVVPLLLYIYNYKRTSVRISLQTLTETAATSELQLINNHPVEVKPKYICSCDLAVLVGGLALRCLFLFAAIPVWSGQLS